MLTVGSLFSGIGGFDLGLERAGMRTRWFCENDDFCRAVLAGHWPNLPCYGDIRELRGADVEPVDVLCGGFPCQDISAAGKGAGLSGSRSGLWSEYARLVGELRPRYVIVENVPLLRTRGLNQVLEDLDACGYDAEWDCLPASAFGAPHRRDRVWIIAYPTGEQHEGHPPTDGRKTAEVVSADADQERRNGWPGQLGSCGRHEPSDVGQDADGESLGAWRVGGRATQAGGAEWWATEPPVGRVAHGVPNRLDQLAALGNALIPQIAEWIGRRIIEYERSLACLTAAQTRLRHRSRLTR